MYAIGIRARLIHSLARGKHKTTGSLHLLRASRDASSMLEYGR